LGGGRAIHQGQRNASREAKQHYMEIFVRLFVWILNLTYRRQDAPLYGANPMDQSVLLEFDESRKLQREGERQTQIVENFKSTATSVHGAVDYDDLKWDSYDRAVETADQFAFYNGRSTQKIIAKSAFTNHQEIVALRRVIHRHIRNCELRDD
jgi:hypothetical protein